MARSFQSQANEDFRLHERHAKAHGFTPLSKDSFLLMASLDCHFCGNAPAATNRDRNGIDRLVNAIGYVAGNIVPACKECNIAKRAMGERQFIAMCQRVAKRHGGA